MFAPPEPETELPDPDTKPDGCGGVSAPPLNIADSVGVLATFSQGFGQPLFLMAKRDNKTKNGSGLDLRVGPLWAMPQCVRKVPELAKLG